MRHCVKPCGVCAKEISFDLVDGIVLNVQFVGGCNGQGITVSRLVDGMTVNEVYALLHDVECGKRGTSCAAELAKAVDRAYREQEV